ncbi:NAD(P)-dependent dehydrogenase, short-chain alcohol dehydrogenase family [Jatrophihabitans endophyticus]|uniref:NAD(P)-dependent dehydrogenase, short-chain alcohol dehydrogenase family n=1 Tax=Jatrophihabitans endophyticus TaxID=1206085 RepID=A0A1M5PWH9_9ACTN|nr:SDR family oxidoreductase [Jatrophihabitans endophyticus]SHH06377.1 NAD(P)-dependent dehydrogenase, short-chain alcohol dehydrogenase family [Jatrophihabitans endophyticus]
MTGPGSVLVTGAGSGIGEACALELGRRGWQVVVADVDADSAERVAAAVRDQAGVVAYAAPVDVTDPDQVEAMVEDAVARLGRLDGAVNNAGIGQPPAAVADVELADWHRTIAVNLHGVFHCLRAELRAMRAAGGGAVVNMGSVMSVLGSAMTPAYAASKHAVVGLTRAAARDHAADGIRVNAVGPGFVRTPLLTASQTPEQAAELAALHPIGRLGEPREVATLVAFLLSDDAANMTGGFYLDDGGFTIQ